VSDIVIIGGGVAGLSAGARLAPHARVTLLEAEDTLGYHASGRSAALFETTYGKPAVVTLNLASSDHHHHANGGYTTPRGLMVVAHADAQEAFLHDLEIMHMARISPEEAKARIPILDTAAVPLAGLHEEAWDLDTDRILQDDAREIRAHGGQIVTRARVTGIARARNRWEVTASGTVHRADLLINAAGAWGDAVARMAGVAALGLTPLRRSMAVIPAPGGHDIRGWPMVFGAGESWYCKPSGGQLLVSPAEEAPGTPHDAWAEDMVLAEGLARYESCVTEPVTRVTGSWAGLRTFAPDRVLVIGRDAAQPAFIWLVGQGGYGFQTAPAASRLAADLILGRPPEVDAATVAALSPGRFG